MKMLIILFYIYFMYLLVNYSIPIVISSLDLIIYLVKYSPLFIGGDDGIVPFQRLIVLFILL